MLVAGIEVNGYQQLFDQTGPVHYSKVLLLCWRHIMREFSFFGRTIPLGFYWFNWASVVTVICVMKIESNSWLQVWSQQILLFHSCDWCIQLTMIKFGYYSLTFCWGVWEEMFKRKQSQNPFEGFIRDCVQIQRIQSLISTRVVLWRKAL